MNKSLEDAVKEELGLSVLKNVGLGGGGFICQGSAYDTDKYGRVFIKVSIKAGAREMFEGEFASLEALGKPNIVRLPKPIKVVDQPGDGAALVMEYLDLSRHLSKHSALLGQQLGRLHLHNASLEEKSKRSDGSVHSSDSDLTCVSRFGFDIITWYGFFEMDNTWCDDWPSFFARRIETHIAILEKQTGDRQVRELWNKVLVRLPSFFEGVEIKPAIIHGDLWSGNISENDEGPIIFDPASFYGHHEFDLGIGHVFGGFDSKFYKAYHELIPRAPGFEKRKDLYKLFNFINHWNHFGEGYQQSTISCLKTCIKHVYQ